MRAPVLEQQSGRRQPSPRAKILVVEDDETVRLGLSRFLTVHGFDLIEAASCSEAERRFHEDRPDAVLLDYRLPDGTALDLLGRLRPVDPGIPFVILTGHGSVELAVRSIKQGAENVLTKPVAMPDLLALLQRLVENRNHHDGALHPQHAAMENDADPFVGSSAALRQLAEQARRIAGRDSTVLILGETGSGKGVLARWLHAASPRTAEPFVDMNCAGLARDLFETELFGHDRGAFTGAVALKRGLLEAANGGTLFLDEIGELHSEVQPKLLKVIEEKRFRRLGSVRDQVVDVRLIAATNRDLAALAAAGTFRPDLYFRINTLPLRVPSLRERTEDIPQLAHRLVVSLCRLHGEDRELTAGAVQDLVAYPWPGNVRELRNVLERAILLSDGRLLTAGDLRLAEWRTGEALTEAPTNVGTELAARRAAPPTTLAQIERREIERVLDEESGQVAVAARRLGISRSTLYNKIQKYGLGPISDHVS